MNCVVNFKKLFRFRTKSPKTPNYQLCLQNDNPSNQISLLFTHTHSSRRRSAGKQPAASAGHPVCLPPRFRPPHHPLTPLKSQLILGPSSGAGCFSVLCVAGPVCREIEGLCAFGLVGCYVTV